MHTPMSSGLLSGGGLKHFRCRRSVVQGTLLRNEIPDVHLSDVSRLKQLVPDFDPALATAYSPRELVLLGEKILLCDPKDAREDPYWLNAQQLRRRSKREIYCASGTPDPAFVSGLYWRTHPDGRAVHSDEQRKKNATSFYCDGKSVLWK